MNVIIKAERLKVVGHIMQMLENGHAIRILNADLDVKCKASRSELRWIDGIVEDLRTKCCINWRIMI